MLRDRVLAPNPPLWAISDALGFRLGCFSELLFGWLVGWLVGWLLCLVLFALLAWFGFVVVFVFCLGSLVLKVFRGSLS